ncbi:hypothetical protein PTKIN_Ptkin02bG0186900 [Pterospermum kingtungense]
MAIIFSKVLAPTDTESNLSIPTGCFVNLPFGGGHLLDMTVYDYECEREWTFCCTVGRDETTDERVLYVDWLEFVRRKSVKPYDKVIFHQEIIDDTDKATLQIEVKRKIRLFGQDIWAPLP